MTSKKTILSLCALQLTAFPLTAQAQSSEFDRAFARQGAEARVSFTIPLGHSSEKSKTAPRLNLGVRNYAQASSASTDWMRVDRQDYRDVSLGFTLEETPKLMMNDQVLLLPDNQQANIGTAGKIGLGVGAVVLVGVAVVVVIFATTDFAEDA